MCDLKCVLENSWKRFAVFFLNLMPINESIIRRFVANSFLKMGVRKAFVANCAGLRNYNIFNMLNIRYLKTKRSAQHRIACYPLATPFRPAQRDKNSVQFGQKPIASFKETISCYVIFRWVRLSAKVKKWITIQFICAEFQRFKYTFFLCKKEDF